MTREHYKLIIESVYPDKKERREMCKHIRLALSGNLIGPDLYDMMEVLGQQTVLKRLKDYLTETPV